MQFTFALTFFSFSLSVLFVFRGNSLIMWLDRSWLHTLHRHTIIRSNLFNSIWLCNAHEMMRKQFLFCFMFFFLNKAKKTENPFFCCYCCLTSIFIECKIVCFSSALEINDSIYYKTFFVFNHNKFTFIWMQTMWIDWFQRV